MIFPSKHPRLVAVKTRPRLRGQSGCITCRVRKVKCDEKKPACNRCSATDRKCEGYTPHPLTRREMIVRIRNDSESSTSDKVSSSTAVVLTRQVLRLRAPRHSIIGVSEYEGRVFDFFTRRSLDHGTQIFDYQFWDTMVLRLVHTEPAVKHAVMALGLLHIELDGHKSGKVRDQYTQLTLREYNKALKYTRNLIAQGRNEDVHLILVLCILFVVMENFAGNYAAARIHLLQGLRLLSRNRHRVGLPTQPEIEATGVSQPKDWNRQPIVNCFDVLDFEAMTFSDMNAPYQYATSPFIPTEIINSPPRPPDQFINLEQASSYVIALVRFTMSLSEAVGIKNLSSQGHQNLESLCVMYNRISFQRLKEFESGIRKNKQPISPHSELTLAVLYMYYSLLDLFLATGMMSCAETRFDTQMSTFQNIIDLARRHRRIELLSHTSVQQPSSATESRGEETASFSLGVGVVLPLFVTAQKCRDSAMRHAALSLLRERRRIEGVWDAQAAATVMESIIKIEEEGLTPEELRQGPSVIPEAKRVIRIDCRTDLPNKSVYVWSTRLLDSLDFHVDL